jgi:hypothetical protein
MANNYSTGTVSPRLPMTPAHVMVFNLLAGLGGDLPPGVDLDEREGRRHGWVLAEQGLLEDALLDSLPSGVEATPLDINSAILGVLRVGNACSGESNWGLGYDKGEDGLCYLYSEEYGAGDDVFEFLQWVLEGLPQIPWISYEYADWCDKTRPGEFGGGAWFFAQGKEPKFTHSGTWIQTQISDLVVDEIIEEIAAGGDE